MAKKTYLCLLFFAAKVIFAQEDISISGSVDWNTQKIDARISLDLASAGLRLPAGRTHAEGLLSAERINQLRPYLLALQVDSSSTISDLIDRGEFSIAEIEAFAMRSNSTAPALSPDLRTMSSAHTIPLEIFSSALLRHNRPSPIMRTLSPVSSALYTGIIIIALDELPVHGMRGTNLPIPCLFPKIWDSEMNLIYERSMLETGNSNMVRYASSNDIFQQNPSGLSPELQQVVGLRPLRIFARGVFGIKPTDLVIDRSDALLIISSEENRRLLSQGKVAIILDDSVLRYEFPKE